MFQIDNKREEDSICKIRMSSVEDPLSTIFETKHIISAVDEKVEETM